MTTNGHVVNFEIEESRIPDVYNAESVEEIRTALAQLHQKEATVTRQLDNLVAAQQEFQRELGRLDLFRASLSSQGSKARSISNGMLADAASAAKRISGSVKRLDEEQARVKATLDVVEQVTELKACVLGVTGSMGAAQDWEAAAGYLSRAQKIPKEVINGAFAAKIVPTGEVPDAPAITLEHASESLCGLFLREFDKAVKESDSGKITRFFKLFPLIDRSDVGLDIYGRYVCQGIAARARSSLNAGTGGNQSKDGFFFATALTRLFEHIAQIIEGHGSLVERHYGIGKMTRVIERLQVEADLQGGIILDTWIDERKVDRQLTDVKSYPYTFLVQSFMQSARGVTAPPRAGSPANAPGRKSEDEGVDMKQVDALLNEMTMMLGKWSLYTRFVSEKCRPPDQVHGETKVPAFLSNSTLMKKIQEKLISPFGIMTTFFFRRSVEKAFQLEEQPSELSLNPHKPLKSSPPHVTSAIEDIMYIVNKVLQQSLATSQLPVVMGVIPNIARVLGADFIGMEQRKMRDESYPKALVQGQLPPEATIVSFIVLINNLDAAKDYIDQIIKARIQPSGAVNTPKHTALEDLFPGPGEGNAVTTTIKSLNTSFSDKTNELISEAITVLFQNVMKPRLRPILLDAFRDTDYAMTKEQLSDLAADLEEEGGDEAEAAYHDQVRQRFQLGWDALTRPIGRLMTASTFDSLLTTVVSYLSKLIEKRLWTYQGRVNQVGASRLEHDVNEIVKVVVKNQKYAFREAFLRSAQICMILNMDQEEWDEIQTTTGGSEVADKLTPEERIRARSMLKETE